MIVFESGEDDLFEKKESRRRNGGFGSIVGVTWLYIFEGVCKYYSKVMLCVAIVGSRRVHVHVGERGQGGYHSVMSSHKRVIHEHVKPVLP